MCPELTVYSPIAFYSPLITLVPLLANVFGLLVSAYLVSTVTLSLMALVLYFVPYPPSLPSFPLLEDSNSRANYVAYSRTSETCRTA